MYKFSVSRLSVSPHIRHRPRWVWAVATIFSFFWIQVWHHHDPGCWLDERQPWAEDLESLRECGVFVHSPSYRHHSHESPFFRGFHGLTVYNGGWWLCFLARFAPHLSSQGIMHFKPCPILFACIKVMTDELVFWKIMRNHPPGTASAEQIKYRIQYLTHIRCPFPPPIGGFWNEGGENLPLCICEIGWVWLTWSLVFGFIHHGGMAIFIGDSTLWERMEAY